MALNKINHPIIVQKYGGSSVASPKSIIEVAKLIKKRRDQGNRLCIVVSAMGKTTDQLLATAKEISKNPSRRELDMLLSCGERASMALLAMALQELNVPSISFTGSQSGIITDDVHSGAKILEVRPYRVLSELDLDKVVIVAGFQGISYKKEITTLGRGGSDTTAIALAAALNAKACEIYSDVHGVYTADPRIVNDAHLLENISFEEMEELATFGAKVLNQEAVLFAKQKGITIFARKTGDNQNETVIQNIDAETNQKITAISYQNQLECICAFSFEQFQSVLSRLGEAGITPNQILSQNNNSFWCFITPEDAHGLEKVLANLNGINHHGDFGTISLIGRGLFNSPSLFVKAIEILKNSHVAIEGTSTSPLRATFVIKKEHINKVILSLHKQLISFV